MKKMRKLFKAFAVHALIASMLQTTLVFSTYAATQADSSGGFGVNEIASLANGTLGIFSQYLGAKQQMVMQQIQAEKNAKIMQTMSPTCRKADGTACYTIAGKFFPECPLPASMSTMPQNICMSMTPEPATIAQMITYEAVAKNWVNYFNQMLNEASNETVPAGLKCLQDKKKALDSQMIEMVNNLTRLQDQLNKDKETFKANNKKLIEDLTATNDELVGSSGKNNLKAKTTNFSKYFSSACQSVIGEEDLKNGPTLGFNGIMQALSPKSKVATDYNQNRTLIENEVRADITKMQNVINSAGLEDFLKGQGLEASKYKSAMVAVSKQAQDFNLAKARIAKELSTIGYSIPEMDKNFAVDMDEFISKSQDFFKKQYVNECVTGADKSGIALPVDKILNALEQKNTGSAGTATQKYRAALKIILDSDVSIDSKMAQMKELESTYKGITITYQDSTSKKVVETPYDLYMKTLAKCEEKFTKSDQFSMKGSGTVSQQKKVERGQALLRELKSLHANYASELSNRVLDKVLSCNGETKKSGAACGKESLDSSSESFCMSQANQCANEIQGCYAEASKHVETRKAKMETLAKVYNHRTEAYVNQANLVYNQQKTAVMNMIKIVQARFPGTNFAIPEGMFVSMPELKKDTYGVDLANDGNLSYMDELPKKITLLKKVFEDQQKKADTEIDDYIQKQSMAMEREKSRWEELAGQCTKNIDGSSQQLAKMNNEGAKKQAEQDAAVAAVCSKYWSLKDNPMAGCDDAKELATDMQKVLARLVPEVQKFGSQFKNTCNTFNNEKADSVTTSCMDEDYLKTATKDQKAACKVVQRRLAASGETTPVKGKGKKLKIDSLCKTDGENKSNKDFIESYISKLAPEESAKFSSSEDKEKLLKAFIAGGTEFEKFINKTQLSDGDALTDMRGLFSTKPGEKICDQLIKIGSGADTSKVDAKVAEVSALKTQVTEKSSEITKLEDEAKKSDTTEIRKAEIAGKISTAKSDLKKAEDAYTDKGKELLIANALTSKTDKDALEKQKDLETALANLQDSSKPEVLSQKELSANDLDALGQQITERCDAQASNVNIAKGMSGFTPITAPSYSGSLNIQK